MPYEEALAYMKAGGCPLEGLPSRAAYETGRSDNERRVLGVFINQVEVEMARAGWSQTTLAALAGITQPMLSRLLRGNDKRSPYLATLLKIADALGMDVILRLEKRK